MTTKGQPDLLATACSETAAPNVGQTARRRIILLSTPASYRGSSFMDAASTLEIDVLHAIDMPSSLAEHWQMTLGLDFTRPYHAAEELAAFVATNQVDAIIA